MGTTDHCNWADVCYAGVFLNQANSEILPLYALVICFQSMYLPVHDQLDPDMYLTCDSEVYYFIMLPVMGEIAFHRNKTQNIRAPAFNRTRIFQMKVMIDWVLIPCSLRLNVVYILSKS